MVVVFIIVTAIIGELFIVGMVGGSLFGDAKTQVLHWRLPEQEQVLQNEELNTRISG